MISSWLYPADILTERLDAPFYSQEYVECERRITKHGVFAFRSLCSKLVDHSFLTVRADDYVENGVPFVRVRDLGDLLLLTDDLKCISRELHLAEGNTIFKPGDILVAKTGKIAASIVPECIVECNTSQDVMGAVVTSADPYYLTTFLGSPSGILQQERWQSGQVQLHLSLGNLRQMNVYVPQTSVQLAIGNITRRAEHFRTLSFQHKSKIDKIFNLSFGELIVRNDKTMSFLKSRDMDERLDAPFYQPKYERLDRFLRSNSEQVAPLRSFVSKPFSGAAIPSDEFGDVGEPVLQIKDIRESEFDIKSCVRIKNSTAKTYSRYAITQCSLILGMSGTVGRTALLEPSNERIIVNQRVAALPVNDPTKAHYLWAFLNSQAGQLQMQRFSVGGVQDNISLEDILRTRVFAPSGEFFDIVSTHARGHLHYFRLALDEVATAKLKIEEMLAGNLNEDQLIKDYGDHAFWKKEFPLLD